MYTIYFKRIHTANYLMEKYLPELHQKEQAIFLSGHWFLVLDWQLPACEWRMLCYVSKSKIFFLKWYNCAYVSAVNTQKSKIIFYVLMHTQCNVIKTTSLWMLLKIFPVAFLQHGVRFLARVFWLNFDTGCSSARAQLTNFNLT